MSRLFELYEKRSTEFDAFLFDIDGTLLLGDHPIPGAADLLHRLRRDAFPFRFLTNNSSQSHLRQAQRLSRAGIEAYPDDFVTCADPLPDYFRRENQSGREWTYFLIGSAEEIPGVIRYEKDPSRIFSCDGILHNGGLHDWRISLSAVFNFIIRNPEKPLMVSNPDLLNPLSDGFSICPNGQMELVIRMLEERGIRKDRVYLGKPYTPIYESACRSLALPAGADRKRILSVGDSLFSDIPGANRFGFRSGLVLTGLTSLAEAQNAFGDRHADFLFDAV